MAKKATFIHFFQGVFLGVLKFVVFQIARKMVSMVDGLDFFLAFYFRSLGRKCGDGVRVKKETPYRSIDLADLR